MPRLRSACPLWFFSRRQALDSRLASLRQGLAARPGSAAIKKYSNRSAVLHDAAWNLIQIDHARAFGSDTELPNRLTRIDRDYWAKIEGLTRKQLDAALRP